MTKRILPLLSLLLVFALLAACAPDAAQTPPSDASPMASAAPTPTPEPTPTPDPIGDKIAAMTLEDKVAQMFVVGFEGTAAEGDVADYIQSYRMGGVILFSRNVASAEQLVQLTNGLKALNAGCDIPLFVGVDQEGGSVERMPPEIKRLPKPYDLGSDVDSYAGADKLGQTLAAECAAFGFNLDFAPSFDVWSNPNNTVIGKRSFSSDPHVASNAALHCALGLRAGGVIPVAKHYPGHGDTDVDSHVGLPVLTKTLEEWQELEFIPFSRGALGSGIDLMVSHVVLAAVDDIYPASLSKKVISALRTSFDGVLFTDDMTMGAITQSYGVDEACVLAVEAGVDVLLVCHKRADIETAYGAVLAAVESGRISPARIDESVRRILTLKDTYALTDEAVPPADVDALNAMVDEVWALAG